MSAHDAFAGYLDLLVETLDEQINGDELARRLYLSRAQFDRIVYAVAGEPPAALRRRVLLERAAYRLLATPTEVLTVALEAGYASHEAFTRAFSKAYGRPPSQWRHSPNGMWLGTGAQVHFHPPGGLRVPSISKETPMDLATRMVEHHLFVLGQFLDRAGTLPAEVLERPIELSVSGVDCDPTIRSLLARLVGQMAMWNAATTNRPYDISDEAGQSLGDIRAAFEVAGPEFLQRVRSVLGGGRLQETFVDATCTPPHTFTYAGMIAHVLTYAAHRRVLVAGAFDSAGISDIQDDPMQWVAGPQS